MRALLHQEPVVASSVIRRVGAGLVKGSSGGEMWGKGHRKEGALVFRWPCPGRGSPFAASHHITSTHHRSTRILCFSLHEKEPLGAPKAASGLRCGLPGPGRLRSSYFLDPPGVLTRFRGPHHVSAGRISCRCSALPQHP